MSSLQCGGSCITSAAAYITWQGRGIEIEKESGREKLGEEERELGLLLEAAAESLAFFLFSPIFLLFSRILTPLPLSMFPSLFPNRWPMENRRGLEKQTKDKGDRIGTTIRG